MAVEETLIPWSTALVELLFPWNCRLCGWREGHRAPEPWSRVLCRSCHSNLPRLTGRHCACCARSLGNQWPDSHCFDCRGRGLLDSLTALYEYRDGARQLIHHFKFHFDVGLANLFAMESRDNISRDYDLIVPVPQHWSRQARRGYNQAWELCRALSRELDIPFAGECLQRVVATPPLFSRDKASRVKILDNVFRCSRELTNQRILLVDDIRTTGTTLSRCAKLLRQRGSSEVHGLCLAMILPHKS